MAELDRRERTQRKYRLTHLPCSVASLSRTNDQPKVSDSVTYLVARVNSRNARFVTAVLSM